MQKLIVNMLIRLTRLVKKALYMYSFFWSYTVTYILVQSDQPRCLSEFSENRTSNTNDQNMIITTTAYRVSIIVITSISTITMIVTIINATSRMTTATNLVILNIQEIKHIDDVTCHKSICTNNIDGQPM